MKSCLLTGITWGGSQFADLTKQTNTRAYTVY